MSAVIQTAAKHVAETLLAQTDRLNDLDAVMGDGEHGSNINKCFSAVVDILPTLDGKDASASLNAIGMKLLSAGGGTATTLMGFSLMKLSQLAKGKDIADAKGIAQILNEALPSIQEKSKAQQGDKTLMDALVPGIEAFSKAADEGKDVKQSFEAAAEASAAGAEKTKDMIAQRGRGLYVGERGLGVEDPGAVSTSLIFKAISETV